MAHDFIPKDLTALREEFVAFRAELRIEMITLKERLRHINEQLSDVPSPARPPQRLTRTKKRANDSTADITLLAVRLGISEQSIKVRIERLRTHLAALKEQAILPEDNKLPLRRLDIAEAEMLALLPTD